MASTIRLKGIFQHQLRHQILSRLRSLNFAACASFSAPSSCASCPSAIALHCASVRRSALSSHQPAQDSETTGPAQDRQLGRTRQFSSQALLKRTSAEVYGGEEHAYMTARGITPESLPRVPLGPHLPTIICHELSAALFSGLPGPRLCSGDRMGHCRSTHCLRRGRGLYGHRSR
jgi:hypothetical protein